MDFARGAMHLTSMWEIERHVRTRRQCEKRAQFPAESQDGRRFTRAAPNGELRSSNWVISRRFCRARATTEEHEHPTQDIGRTVPRALVRAEEPQRVPSTHGANVWRNRTLR